MAEREDVHAALEARRELGPEYEPQIIDSFLERIEKRLGERRGLPAHLHKPPQPPALVVPLSTVAMGIPITAVALSNSPGAGGVVVAIIAWIAIAIVNVAYAMRRR
jgi:hypothetical protein